MSQKQGYYFGGVPIMRIVFGGSELGSLHPEP